MKHLFLIVILKTAYSFGMEGTIQNAVAYPLTFVSHNVSNMAWSLTNIPFKVGRYYYKYYNDDTQRKILGLNDSYAEEAKNKDAYNAVNFFINNMKKMEFLHLNNNVKDTIYIGLSRGSYVAYAICEMLSKQDPMFDCYDRIRTANTLLSKHITSLLGPLKIIAELGARGERELAEEYDNDLNETVSDKRITRLASIIFFIEQIEFLVNSINAEDKIGKKMDVSYWKSLNEKIISYIPEE